MPTTTNFGWTTPADTDLVKDGAAAIRTLAGNIDTSLVDLKGGTTGQVLSKNSNSDLDFTYITVSVPANATATVATQETTSSATYTDLTTAGPAVTVTTGTKALVILTSNMRDREDRGWFMSYAVSGATTISADDTRALSMVTPTQPAGIYQVSFAHVVTSLSAGSNTFTAKYRTISTAHSAVFKDRSIFVINLG
jgi:hypothetical protein